MNFQGSNFIALTIKHYNNIKLETTMRTSISKLTKNIRYIIAASAAASVVLVSPVLAQEDADTESIIVTGTRMTDRSAADSPVPVDIISGDEFRQNSSADVQDLLRTAVPSFNINSQPITLFC